MLNNFRAPILGSHPCFSSITASLEDDSEGFNANTTNSISITKKILKKRTKKTS